MPTNKQKKEIETRAQKKQTALFVQQQKQVEKIFNEACQAAAAIGASVGTIPDGKQFTFDKANPAVKKRAEKMLNQLNTQLEAAIVNGIRSAWTLSNNKNNELTRVVLGKAIGKIGKEQERRYFSNNGKALEAFLQRKEKGMDLSQRVWQVTKDYQELIERGLELGIKTGNDAQTMARDLKAYLKQPDKLFRRVRDDNGDLQLSKRAAQYHPGQGVYRSSYKNALRLAITETNMAYRTADYERWQDMDFVIGIRIVLSNNHTTKDSKGKTVPLKDICDELQGTYPKTFKFTGWHPHCRCHVETILKSEDEIMADNRRILKGEEPKPNGKEVDKLPKQFTEWLENNQERIDKASALPYFLRDNQRVINPPKYGIVTGTKLGREAAKEAARLYEDMPAPTITQEQQNNISEIAKEMNIKVSPMTFLEANEGRSNINYHKGGEFTDNCQSCVVVHEARLRGLDITAIGYDSSKESASYQLGEHIEKAWINPKTGKTPNPTMLKGKNDNEVNAKLEKQTKAVGRYHIGVNNRNGSGHVITAERLKSGKIIYYDAQTGQFINIKEFVDIDYFEVLKVDKYIFDKSVLFSIAKVVD